MDELNETLGSIYIFGRLSVRDFKSNYQKSHNLLTPSGREFSFLFFLTQPTTTRRLSFIKLITSPREMSSTASCLRRSQIFMHRVRALLLPTSGQQAADWIWAFLSEVS